MLIIVLHAVHVMWKAGSSTYALPKYVYHSGCRDKHAGFWCVDLSHRSGTRLLFVLATLLRIIKQFSGSGRVTGAVRVCVSVCLRYK